ncbi:MAG: hypothetical protein ABIQ39_01550, partial [Ilumatobacteraceae bacterium]
MQSQHSHWFERARRRSAPAVVVAALLLCGFVAVPHSSADSQTAAQIADQIVALQARADSVAAEWARHDTEATQFTIDIAAAQQSVDAAGATSAAMEAALGKVAVDRYTGAMQPEIIPFSADVMPRVEMAALSELAFNSGLINLDGLRLAHADLSRKKRSLDQLKSKNDAALAALERSRETLDKQLADLATLQAKLNDAEVKSAYEAKVAALRKQQAADAAATVTTLHTPVVPARGGGVTQPTPSPTTPAASPPQPPTPDTRPTKDAPSSSTP